MGKRLDVTDQIFGRLLVLVIDWYRTNQGKGTYWWCQCECNNIVSVYLGRLRNGNTKSCGCLQKEKASERMSEIGKESSGENHYKWKEKVVIICKWCGKEKEVFPSLKETKFCSEKCFGQWKSENCMRENSSNWKNGITPFCKQIRNSQKSKDLIQEMFKKANYTCQLSQEKGIELNVHHIKSFAKILEENNITTEEEAKNCEELWNENNVIVLSEKWHLGQKTNNPNAFHRLYGTRNFTEKDFYTWFNKYKFEEETYANL